MGLFDEQVKNSQNEKNLIDNAQNTAKRLEVQINEVISQSSSFVVQCLIDLADAYRRINKPLKKLFAVTPPHQHTYDKTRYDIGAFSETEQWMLWEIPLINRLFVLEERDKKYINNIWGDCRKLKPRPGDDVTYRIGMCSDGKVFGQRARRYTHYAPITYNTTVKLDCEYKEISLDTVARLFCEHLFIRFRDTTSTSNPLCYLESPYFGTYITLATITNSSCEGEEFYYFYKIVQDMCRGDIVLDSALLQSGIKAIFTPHINNSHQY